MIKRALVFSVGAAVLIGNLIHGTPVQALTTVTLDEWNDSVLNASSDAVTVTYDFDGTNTTLTYTWFDGDSGLTALGIDQVGFTFSGSSTVTCAVGWTCGTSSTLNKQMSTFGIFAQRPTDSGGTDLTVTFTLSGNVTFVTNSTGNLFAAHVRYGDGCSGFVGDFGPGAAPGGASDCGGTSVPEPASVMLLGAGFAGIGIWRRMSTKI